MIEHSLLYFGTATVKLQRHGENQDGYVRESERSNEEKAIDQLEMAQLDGSLVREVKKAQTVVLRLSRHGVQIMTPDRQLTLRRIALLNIHFTVAYDDGFGKFNCAIMENCLGDSGQCRAHVFQAESRVNADRVMVDVDTLFKQVEEECSNLPSPLND